MEDHGFFGNLVEGLDTHQQLLAGVQDLGESDQEEDTPTESVATNTSVDENETKSVDQAEKKLGTNPKL